MLNLWFLTHISLSERVQDRDIITCSTLLPKRQQSGCLLRHCCCHGRSFRCCLCYRRNSMVCVSVQLCWSHTYIHKHIYKAPAIVKRIWGADLHESCKNGWTDRDAIWGWLKEPCIRWGSRFPTERGNLGGRPAHWQALKVSAAVCFTQQEINIGDSATAAAVYNAPDWVVPHYKTYSKPNSYQAMTRLGGASIGCYCTKCYTKGEPMNQSPCCSIA